MVTRRVTGNSTDREDPWAVAQTNGYDIDMLYTRSCDGKGHSENIQAKLSPAMIGELQNLVQSKALPDYRTIQDFIRDACVHRAKYVTDMIANDRVPLEFGGIVAAEAMLSRIEQRKERRVLGQRLLEETTHEIKELMDAGKKSDAWDCVEEFAQASETWRDETVYRHMVHAVEQWRGQLTGQEVPAGIRRVQ